MTGINKKNITIDGNAAAAYVAYAFSEVAALYPITPASPIGENVDEWATGGRRNLFGDVVSVVEMQSEAGAAGAVHGSLSAGSLTSTFTASQGLLLMIPDMYKIAGEMLPCVFHVASRSLASQSLSIFGDHSDVMAARSTGFAFLCSSGVQEVMDLSLVAHLATLKSSVPFVSFFDGFRTSHEIRKIEEISYEDMLSLVEERYLRAFRRRAMRPESPFLKAASQNDDVYFQGRESTNAEYARVPLIVQEYMDKVGNLTGRRYKIFDYEGDTDAQYVAVCMGSGFYALSEAAVHLRKMGVKAGVVNVRLFRPFSREAFLKALPKSVKRVAVLDRTKEAGSFGEPLFLDIASSLLGTGVKVIGGRYGLSSKDFTPSDALAVFRHLMNECTHDFTVGINDDVTFKSLKVDEKLLAEGDDVTSCMFWGFGSDGTVGANKETIKILGNHTSFNVQAYFVYDSKKSGGVTVSHLRFAKAHTLNMPWLIRSASFVMCNSFSYIGRYDMVTFLKRGGIFLVNSVWDEEEVFSHFTREMQEFIIKNEIRVYTINAVKIASSVGLGRRTSTVMQSAFFFLTSLLDDEEALLYMKESVKKKFMRKGEEVVAKNVAAIEAGFHLTKRVEVPERIEEITESYEPPSLLREEYASDFAKSVIEKSMRLQGGEIPVSFMSKDGTLPLGTAKLEKRMTAESVPIWFSEKCIQCNQCALACPHASIRAKQIYPENLKSAPATFEVVKSKTRNESSLFYRVQVYPADCQGCTVCVDVCPAKEKALKMVPINQALSAGEMENSLFFDSLPENVTEGATKNSVKEVQFHQPLFEFSGACAGCGETPYIKLLTQLFGEYMIIANATGCSSIYSGTFPTTPYCTASNGRGPAWANSLFEDNAEYGFGMRMAVDYKRRTLFRLIKEAQKEKISGSLSSLFDKALSKWDEKSEESVQRQDEIKTLLRSEISVSSGRKKALLSEIDSLSDYFVDKSVWIIGGDGWAYDIDYGGIDHVISMGMDVNLLVLDTEVYSNTGGQASKSTPIAAVAKFATSGMKAGKKKMPFMCMTYGNVYVASVALNANRNQTHKAFIEAEGWKGPSIIFAYSPCIAHGVDMALSAERERLAVECGYWPLFRYNPSNDEGRRFSFDAKDPKGDFMEFLKCETRYTSLKKIVGEDEAASLYEKAQKDSVKTWAFYKALGELL